MNWPEMMNGFELLYTIYTLLYCIIGLAGCMTTLLVWFLLRMVVPKLTIPRFQFVECYEFMLWWPFCGVTIASFPILVLMALIYLMFLPIFDPFTNYGCDWMHFIPENQAEKDYCKSARIGACLFIA